MVINLRQEAEAEKKAVLKGRLKALGFDIHESKGVGTELWGLVGDTSILEDDYLRANEVVEDVMRVQEPYKKANRKLHPEATVIQLPTGQVIGDGSLPLIAVPCSVEREAKICCVEQHAKDASTPLLRRGAYKDRH